MTEIRFYHLASRTQDQALPVLLAKAYEQGKRVVVKMPDEKQVEALNTLLWTYNPNSFLPHGSAKTTGKDDASLQPLWLTDRDENPNNADVLVVTHGADSAIQSDFALCCEMFDGHDERAVAAARERWKVYKSQDFEVTYWKQDERGAWSKSS